MDSGPLATIYDKVHVRRVQWCNSPFEGSASRPLFQRYSQLPFPLSVGPTFARGYSMWLNGTQQNLLLLEMSSVSLQNQFSISMCNAMVSVMHMCQLISILLQVKVGHHDILLKSKPRHIIRQQYSLTQYFRSGRMSFITQTIITLDNLSASCN